LQRLVTLWYIFFFTYIFKRSKCERSLRSDSRILTTSTNRATNPEIHERRKINMPGMPGMHRYAQPSSASELWEGILDTQQPLQCGYPFEAKRSESCKI